MDNAVKVAVVRSDRRRGAVAEALSLIASDLRQSVQADPAAVIIPNLDNFDRPWACTHHDTLSATVDAALAAGARSITVRSPSGERANASSLINKLGYRSDLWGRPVSFPGIDTDLDDWTTIRGTSPLGEPISFRVSSDAAASRCRISLGVARTHGVFRVGLGLCNLRGIVHEEDQRLMGLRSGARSGLFPGRAMAAGLMESGRGWLVRSWLAVRSVSGGMRLTRQERSRLEAVERATTRLLALSAFMPPNVSVIDGFAAMQGEGPRHGRRVALGTVVAGTDAVAVDAVAASMMGFEPMEIAYLRLANAMGLGVADLSAISIIGDPVSHTRRRLRRHSFDRLLRLADSPQIRRKGALRPHFGSVPGRTHAGQVARTN
jgi:uncharacterized protein (DUF362 family)